MTPPRPAVPEITAWLRTLGITSLCQWDVLVFLSRHQTTLLGAAHLARLLGYASDLVVAALDVLEALELVARSRVFQGACLYQCSVPLDSPHGAALAQLQTLATTRAGWVRQQMRPRALLVVCAWCTKSLRRQSVKDTVALYATSHSICPICLETVLRELRESASIIPVTDFS
jgi:hypothetical protein